MSTRMLRKVLADISSFPPEEVKKLIEETLAEADLYIELLNTSPVAHMVVDRESHIVVYVNKAINSIVPSESRKRLRWGLKLERIVIDPDVKKFILAVFSGKIRAEERDFAFQRGEETRTLRVAFRDLKVRDQDFVDITVTDITDNIRQEMRLRRSESLASMTSMAAGIAHEIKNPLAAMKIHLQLLRKAYSKGPVSAEQAERYLKVIEEEIDHLNDIAVDFLFAVKPMNITLSLGPLNEVVEDLAVFIAPEAKEKAIEVRLELEDYLPNIELDPNHMRQCLLNIIQNAFAAMPGGGVLALSTYSDGDYVAIRVQDNGTGMSEEQLSKIFEPYFTTKASGTGLGLTVVYKIVKEHKGDIMVASEPGKGTVFTIKLPVPRSQRKAIGGVENEDTIDS